MEDKELNFREKTLIKLILKAAQKKKERLKNASLQQARFLLKGQNMN